MKRILIISIFVTMILAPVFGVESRKNIKTYNKVVENNLVSIGKNIIVNGVVNKNLIKIGGSLKLNGKVGKDVVCISSKVELGKDFSIKGDLIVIGGSLRGKDESRVGGDIHNINFSFEKIETSLSPVVLNSKTVNLIKIIFLVMSLIVSLFLFSIIPVRIKRAEELLSDNFLRIGLLGIVSVFSFVLLFLLSVILSFIYVGIPMLLILLMFLISLFIFGRAVIYYSIGKKIISKFNISVFSPAFFILMGVMVYFILSLIPVIGFIILKVLAIFELGISVSFIFKKKLNLKSISEFVDEYGNE